MFFEKSIDLTNRNEMIAFLSNHFRYHTMNSWNQSTSYANDVKLYNLGLSDEELDLAYDIICGDMDISEFQLECQFIFDEFHTETGYIIGSNGRSGGYLVLYDTNKDGSLLPGRSIDQNEDFTDPDEWDLISLQERTKLICRFDHACDQIRDLFRTYLSPDCIHTKTVTYTKEIRYLSQNEEEIV